MKFRFNRGAFTQRINQLRTAIRESAEDAMTVTMAEAENYAREMKRWNNPGVYRSAYDAKGNEIEWTVTGQAAASLTGYVVSPTRVGKPRSLPTKYSKVRVLRAGSVVREWTKTHATTERLAHRRTPREGKVVGVLTMSVAYAIELQTWEQREGDYPVTVEVFETHWNAALRPLLRRVLMDQMRAYRR